MNGETSETGAATLAALLAERAYGDAKVATALNGSFVPATDRGETAISEGDRVEIVAPRQGG